MCGVRGGVVVRLHGGGWAWEGKFREGEEEIEEEREGRKKEGE